MNNNSVNINKLVALLPVGAFSTDNCIDAPYFLYRNNGDIDKAIDDLLNYSYDEHLSSHEAWCFYWLEWLKDTVSQQG